jgi:hypothetical protein
VDFSNNTGEFRMIPSLGVALDHGETFTVTADDVPGLALQDGFAPADEEAVAAVAAALASDDPNTQDDPDPDPEDPADPSDDNAPEA